MSEIGYKCGLVRTHFPNKPPFCVEKVSEWGNCGDCLTVALKHLFDIVDRNATDGSLVEYSDPKRDGVLERWVKFKNKKGYQTLARIAGGGYTEQILK